MTRRIESSTRSSVPPGSEAVPLKSFQPAAPYVAAPGKPRLEEGAVESST